MTRKRSAQSWLNIWAVTCVGNRTPSRLILLKPMGTLAKAWPSVLLCKLRPGPVRSAPYAPEVVSRRRPCFLASVLTASPMVARSSPGNMLGTCE